MLYCVFLFLFREAIIFFDDGGGKGGRGRDYEKEF